MSDQSALRVTLFIRDNTSTFALEVPDTEETEPADEAVFADTQGWKQVPLDQIREFWNVQETDLNDHGLVFETGGGRYFLPSSVKDAPPAEPPPETDAFEQLRNAYDQGIEALADRFARLEDNGTHCWTEPNPGFWPHLLIEGRNGPVQVVTFRGFHHEFHLIIPREHFGAFLPLAIAHLEAYPADAYGLGDGKS